MFKLGKHRTIIASLYLPLGSVKTTGLGRRKTTRERAGVCVCVEGDGVGMSLHLTPQLSSHHSIPVSVGRRGQHCARLQRELREVLRILCHNRADPSVLFIKILCAVFLQVVWVLKGAPGWQAVVPVVGVVERFLGFLGHRQYAVLQVLGVPQGVGEGVEIEWFIHVLILRLGRTAGSAVIFRVI